MDAHKDCWQSTSRTGQGDVGQAPRVSAMGMWHPDSSKFTYPKSRFVVSSGRESPAPPNFLSHQGFLCILCRFFKSAFMCPFTHNNKQHSYIRNVLFLFPNFKLYPLKTFPLKGKHFHAQNIEPECIPTNFGGTEESSLKPDKFVSLVLNVVLNLLNLHLKASH